MGLKPRQWIILLTFYTVYLIFGKKVIVLAIECHSCSIIWLKNRKCFPIVQQITRFFTQHFKKTIIQLNFQGACVFYHIEHNAETERRAKELQARIDINGRWFNYLLDYCQSSTFQIQSSQHLNSIWCSTEMN